MLFSGEYKRTIIEWVAEEESCLDFADMCNRPVDVARVHDQDIQEVWKAWLQMQQRKGAWSEVLSLYQFYWETSGNEVYSPRSSRGHSGVCGELSANEEAYRGSLRNQSRIVETKEFIENAGKSYCSDIQPHGRCRYRLVSGYSSQYDSGLYLFRNCGREK